MKFIHLLNIRLGVACRGAVGSIYRSRFDSIMSNLSKVSSELSCPYSHNVTHSDDATKLPQTTEWKTLDTQVGGHQFAHGKYEQQKLGIVDIGNGLILKSVQNPPRGERELNFYHQIFNPNCDNADLLELRPFVSSFYGTEDREGLKFLKLANLASGFKNPCVIDLKMGKVTYDQDATAEKIAHEVEKYPPLKVLGFQVTGMMIYNPVTQLKESYGKPYCRILTEDNIIHDGLGRFFQLHNNDLRRDVIQQLIFKLKKIESWFLKQKKYSFIASSLLIIYEGCKTAEIQDQTSARTDLSNSGQIENRNNLASTKDTSSNCSKANPYSDPSQDIFSVTDSTSFNIEVPQKQIHDEELKKVRLPEPSSPNSNTSPNDINEYSPMKEVQVHLIDFAHVFPAQDIDHNFLFGLQKLITCLQTLVK
uniref:Kinase n=1 Tax=Arion vulgaris TaxID=1028688 RepID=A0A0B6YPL8_9EUPU